MADKKIELIRYRNISPNPAGVVVAGVLFPHKGEAAVPSDIANHPVHSSALLRAQMMALIEPVR